MNLGIVGAGMIVKDFLSFSHELPEIKLEAIVARNIENLKNLQNTYNIKQIYTDLDECLSSPSIDTIYVAVPNNLHYSVAKKALEAGKNVICEKPFTLDYNETVELFQLAESKNLILIEAITNQYLPNYLEIKENQTVAFVGHTGSGKSTIMNLVVKFYEPNKGVLKIGGKEISEYSRKYLREHIAIVLQDSFLFEGTLLENITTSGDKQLAKEALTQVGGEFILENHSLESKVEIGGSNFSTGEKQLICLARALAKNPKILILDESTANIDSETEQSVGKAIRELKQGRTTLIIAHRLSTIKNADNIFVLNKGVVVESGNHEQLLQKNGVYKKMYETQING